MILKKVLSIIVKIFLGLYILYLFCALALIPLFSPLLIKKQGTKILKTPVSVRGVYFNPLFFTVHIVGMEIRNNSQQKLIGFDRSWVDISFKDFFKRIIHIESSQIDGLFVHATLMKDGRVDLLDLMPGTASAQSDKPRKTPTIVVDTFVLKNAFIHFNDYTLQPAFRTTLRQFELTVSGFSTVPGSVTTVDLTSFVDEKGVLAIHTQLKPFQRPLELKLNLSLEQYALPVMSPYAEKYAGRRIVDGKLDFNTMCHLSNNHLNATHHVLVRYFNFGENVESQDRLEFPFGLAVALLEDPDGRIGIDLPVKGDLSQTDLPYPQLLWKTLREYLMTLVGHPFASLGGAAGNESNKDLGSINFLPGKSKLSAQQISQLRILAQALKDRPRLILEITGTYDLTTDWKETKAKEFHRDYEAFKKESSKNESRILQDLYQRRYGVRQLWKLTKAFKTKNGYDYEKLNAELKRQLGEDAYPDRSALNKLATERAKAVSDIILKEHLDPRRVKIMDNQQVEKRTGLVPLELKLTVQGERE